MSKASKAREATVSRRISIQGQVQGIGFRPAVYRLACRLDLRGWVANDAAGAVLEVEGSRRSVERFLADLTSSLPPHTRIDRLTRKSIPSRGFTSFSISPSAPGGRVTARIPPDLAMCPDCREELFSPSDRRYLYPFINCTNCGPRFTIVRELPYDRPKTTMAGFLLCPDCRREYEDPADRRFHAQPDACPVCGPGVELVSKDFVLLARKLEAVSRAVSLLRSGRIVAVKSLGGYHLACDAGNDAAVRKLRRRKDRPDKPFAVMVRDMRTARALCAVNAEEERALTSEKRPIVLLRRKAGRGNGLSGAVAPGNAYLGVMLPYTPLHELLFHRLPGARGEPPAALVMTSGNRRDEPICRTEEDAMDKLAGIADALLVHNRPIHNRADDSIVQVLPGAGRSVTLIRRSRGFVPEPVELGVPRGKKRLFPVVLGTGAELKNAFCLTRDSSAYVSQYIGELDNREAMLFYREAIGLFQRLLQVKPEIIAHDLHPDYLSSAYAREASAAKPSIRLLPVQHHHAHIASVMAEARLSGPVIGFSFDGTGLGTDGKIWGGECLLVRGDGFKRLAHLDYFPLPGGDLATREIWRIAVPLLRRSGIEKIPAHLEKKPWHEILAMTEKGVNSPDCCSAGRLFDGVAAVIGLRSRASFEAQAAMELESLAVDNRVRKGYNFNINHDDPATVSWTEIIRGIWKDIDGGTDRGVIAAKFHLTMAEMIVQLAATFGKRHGVRDVALSGGVFQNRVLLTLAMEKLTTLGFSVHINRFVPANDGGIALGQAWVALNSSNKQQATRDK